jgi:hypothetical protein
MKSKRKAPIGKHHHNRFFRRGPLRLSLVLQGMMKMARQGGHALLARMGIAERKQGWEKERIAALQKTITMLDPDEWAVLHAFSHRDQPTLHLPYENPIVVGLLSKGVLQIAGRFARDSAMGPAFPMMVSREVKTLLGDGSSGTPRL